MINIIYLIPFDTIGGGVEVAAKGINTITSSRFVISLEYIFSHKSEIFSFSIMTKTIRRLKKIKPDESQVYL